MSGITNSAANVRTDRFILVGQPTEATLATELFYMRRGLFK